MGMDRIAERLRLGQPLRVGELSDVTGWSVRTLQKLMEQGGIRYVQIAPESERRIPIDEVRRIASEAGIRL